MRVIVLSLGGSLIVPEKMDYNFLKKFKQVIRKTYRTHKFVIVCGGGVLARKYISVLKKEEKNHKEVSLAGIEATRMNAHFMTRIFGKEANSEIPKNMLEVKNMLEKNKVVFCGALRYAPRETSDGTAAKLAHYFKTIFINITNIDTLYSSDPSKNKNAKPIRQITWKDFETIAKKIPFKPGQHFVLDQKASSLIRKHKIPTYIIGKKISNLNKILKNQPFLGTSIKG